VNPIIRTATLPDIPQVMQLQDRWAAADETIGYQPADRAMLESFLTRFFCVAEVDHTVIGYIFGQRKQNTDGSMNSVIPQHSDYLEIEDLYVTDELRSKGVGKQLVQAAQAWAKQNSMSYLSVYSSTRDVERILRFYQSCGFNPWYVQLTQDLRITENKT